MRKLTDSERKTVEENLGLVVRVIRKYGDFGTDSIEDAVQVGMIGLMKAAMGYDSRRSKFSTFATACILNELRMHWRSRSRRNGGKAPVSLDAPCLGDGMDNLTLLDRLSSAEPDIADAVADADLAAEAQKVLDGIDTLQARVAGDYVRSGLSQVELARSYGLTQSYVSRCIRLTFQRLREGLEAKS